MKKKVFIGSSSESANIAEKIKVHLQQEYDCIIWNDNFFQPNNSTYDDLQKKSIYFDFAVFVGGKDDFVMRYSNRKTKKAVRDNIYFELGLYTGILSKDRTFFFVDSEVKIATDLLGITILRYAQPDDIISGCKRICEKMKEEETINRIMLLPSTSLFISYYKNFLKPLGDVVSECKDIYFDGRKYKIDSWCMTVILPLSCNEDWTRWTSKFYKNLKVINYEIRGRLRDFSVKICVDRLRTEQILSLVDVPQSISTSFEAVELFTGKDYIGNTKELNYMKEKEVQNFMLALYNLIEDNPLLNSKIKITRENGC